jgi:glutamate dehydrogenase (NAD(P)+)
MYKLKNNNSIDGFPEAEQTKDDLKSRDCDVLILAAMEMTLHTGNAGDIKAKVSDRVNGNNSCLSFCFLQLIVEGANGPITPGAHSMLLDKKVLIIPDFYCNSGGVIGKDWIPFQFSIYFHFFFSVLL